MYRYISQRGSKPICAHTTSRFRACAEPRVEQLCVRNILLREVRLQTASTGVEKNRKPFYSTLFYWLKVSLSPF